MSRGRPRFAPSELSETNRRYILWLVNTDEGRARDERSTTILLYGLRQDLSPGHPALKILEMHRAHKRGERGPLTTEELDPLHPESPDARP